MLGNWDIEEKSPARMLGNWDIEEKSPARMLALPGVAGRDSAAVRVLGAVESWLGRRVWQ